MKVNYRQGIVTSNVDTNGIPNFLSNEIKPNYISLYVNANSVIINFAHGEYNYLYEEANTIDNAWGPFEAPLKPCYWLYWDINTITGIRTFGYSIFEPIVDVKKPTNVDRGQMWFNPNSGLMYEYDGYGWYEKIRVLAGKYANNILTPYMFESQVGINTENFSGYILFDDNDLPLIRSNNSKFLTTESQFYTTKSVISPVKFDSNLFYASAIENIPAYSVVSYFTDNQIALASSSDLTLKNAVGIIRNEVYRSEVTAVVSNGYVTNTDWNFNEPPATPLYLGTHGMLQSTPPQSGFIQKIGEVVSRDTILIDIDPQIIYSTGESSTLSPLSVDLLSGKLFTNEIIKDGNFPDTGIPGGTGPGTVPEPTPNESKVIGVQCVQKIPRMKWTINHNLQSVNVFVQVFDESGDYVIPNSIRVLDANTIEIYFNAPTAGTAQLLVVIDPLLVIIPNLNTPTYEFDFPVLSDVWVVEHDIGHNPIVRVYDSDGVQMIPYSIEHVTVDKTIISFARPRTGFVRML